MSEDKAGEQPTNGESKERPRSKEALNRLVQQMNAAMDKSRVNAAESALPEERAVRKNVND